MIWMYVIYQSRGDNAGIQTSVGLWTPLSHTVSARVWSMPESSLIWRFAIARHTLHHPNVITTHIKWTNCPCSSFDSFYTYFIVVLFHSIDKNQYCNYTQLKCIAKHNTNVLMDKHRDKIKPCLSLCAEMHIGLIG